MIEQIIDFAADEVRTSESTREARLDWVIVVDSTLPPGRIVKAAASVAAPTGPAVPGLRAQGGTDADGGDHTGLPRSGCAILAAEPGKLRQVRVQAARRDDSLVVDMPHAAHVTRDRIVGGMGMLP
ncbi:DUF2000 family protein [Arthrobacter sp. NA-172]|uniref:DUF2000 family protein n=1 Tax=Arthrobacter sp. NA-172 TaxID=3367524 RepID=UPI003754F5E3